MEKLKIELVILDSEQEKLAVFMCGFRGGAKEFAEKYHIAPYTIMTKKIDNNHNMQLLGLNIKTKDSIMLQEKDYSEK